MHIPKRYLHDKLILLLVSVTVFLVLLCGTLIFLRGGSTGGSGVYIVAFRENQGIHSWTRDGSMTTLLSFVPFVLIVAVTNILLSVRAYHIRRTLSVAILGCGILVLLLAVIVSNMLMVYS